ncbi:monogalactosyldiacylglycerol synthase 3, chloroplastic-like [Vigna unguiculata]|uniref:monogalactosyldiacylglycerol synthase 3, chloroplastic-like n=1 Tax=Vigna unguiculata TaxID=3917 RepID=UPI001016FED3|nr:monogalactosyldiacylglycerol synthase 3, chloroplastic-like [Vigna unguiculata]
MQISFIKGSPSSKGIFLLFIRRYISRHLFLDLELTFFWIRGFQTHLTKWIEVCGCIITKSRLTGTMAEALIIGLPIII